MNSRFFFQIFFFQIFVRKRISNDRVLELNVAISRKNSRVHTIFDKKNDINESERKI